MKIWTHLNENHVPYVVLDHAPVNTALEVSRELGEHPDFIAKSVLLHSMHGYVVAILPASCMIDLKRAAAALGTDKVTLATRDEIHRMFPDCEAGVVPAFGSLYGLRTLVDHLLTADATIVFEGNTHRQAFRMDFADFRRLEHPMVARFTKLD